MAYNLAEMEEDLEEALEYARRALDLAPDELQQFPLAALGWVHYKRKEYDEAVDCLSRSNDLGPSLDHAHPSRHGAPRRRARKRRRAAPSAGTRLRAPRAARSRRR